MPRRATLSNPVDSVSVLSAKHTIHGTAIGDFLSPDVKAALVSLGARNA